MTGAKNLSQLKPLLKGRWLRRLTRDVLRDLPPLRVDIHRLALSSDMKATIDALAREWGREEWKKPNAGSRRELGIVKAKVIAKLVDEELKQGYYESVVVMYHHRDVLDIFVDALSHYNPRLLIGGQSMVGRETNIQQFNAGGYRVLLVQQQAGGTGVNLQAASEIILAEPDWSPDVNRQAIKRIHRIGQDSPCRARIFAAPGSFDEAVMGRIRDKILMQQEAGL